MTKLVLIFKPAEKNKANCENSFWHSFYLLYAVDGSKPFDRLLCFSAKYGKYFFRCLGSIYKRDMVFFCLFFEPITPNNNAAFVPVHLGIFTQRAAQSLCLKLGADLQKTALIKEVKHAKDISRTAILTIMISNFYVL